MFMKLLTENGQVIFEQLKEHCEKFNIVLDGSDELELVMLANSFDTYARCAKVVNEKGETQKPEKGGWDQLRPEYITMQREYQNIMKMGSKFGLNPTDRMKSFRIKPEDKRKKNGGFDLK